MAVFDVFCGKISDRVTHETARTAAQCALVTRVVSNPNGVLLEDIVEVRNIDTDETELFDPAVLMSDAGGIAMKDMEVN